MYTMTLYEKGKLLALPDLDINGRFLWTIILQGMQQFVELNKLIGSSSHSKLGWDGWNGSGKWGQL